VKHTEWVSINTGGQANVARKASAQASKVMRALCVCALTPPGHEEWTSSRGEFDAG